MTVLERLVARLVPAAGGCLEFHGASSSVGYGQLRIQKRTHLAHRMAWELANGPIPAGMCVLHHCDNRKCCNVEHLFLGTRADNTADMLAKHRHGSQRKTHCVNGHPLEGDNLVVIRRYDTSFRACLTCRRASQRAYKERQRA